MKRIITTDRAPAAVGPYSQAVEANGFLFCSGQIPLRPDGSLVEGGVAEQTTQCLDNLIAVLAARKLGPSNVVKINVYLTDMGDFNAMNQIYGRYFPSDPPARAAVAVRELPMGAAVELEAVAVIERDKI